MADATLGVEAQMQRAIVGPTMPLRTLQSAQAAFDAAAHEKIYRETAEAARMRLSDTKPLLD